MNNQIKLETLTGYTTGGNSYITATVEWDNKSKEGRYLRDDAGTEYVLLSYWASVTDATPIYEVRELETGRKVAELTDKERYKINYKEVDYLQFLKEIES